MAKSRAALACFLAYAVMSGMLAPMGIISQPLAAFLGVDVPTATAGFSWLTMGIFAGAVAALWLLAAAPLRPLLVLVYLSIAALLVSLSVAGSATGVGLRLALVGALCGLGLPGAAHVIAATFSAERRTALLVLTDGAFSVAGIVAGAVASTALASSGPWYQVYLWVAGAAGLAALLFAFSPLPATEARRAAVARPRWPARAWWLIAALGGYTLGQSSLLLWLPQFAQSLGSEPEAGGALIGRYWSGMFATQLFVAAAVLRFGERRLLAAAALGTALGAAAVTMAGSFAALLWLVPAWGFANFALLKVVIGFAVSATRIESPTFISALLLGATGGTACGPAISSWLVGQGGISAALLFAVLSLGFTAAVLLAQLRLRPLAAR
jgi:TsgA-like MFS transporter